MRVLFLINSTWICADPGIACHPEPQWPITCICKVPAWFGNTVYNMSFPLWSSIIYFSQIPRHFMFRLFMKEHRIMWWNVWALESERSGVEARLCCEPWSGFRQLYVLRAPVSSSERQSSSQPCLTEPFALSSISLRDADDIRSVMPGTLLGLLKR